MRGCGMFNGILFSRKPCPEPAVTTCGRCATPICKLHVRPQLKGRFLCPNCDAYENDDDWRYSDRDRGWHYRTSSSDTRPVAAAAAAGAAAHDLTDDDKSGLNAAGAWHGPDGATDAADGGADTDDGSGGDMDDDGGFDAS
jgi:hypothetical protein